jgi:hypothetical protein
LPRAFWRSGFSVPIIQGSDDPHLNVDASVRSEIETFGRHRRYQGMTQPDIWYVSFGPDRTDKSATSTVRSTRTFKSEIDAKLFAMQILSKGWIASAGTLNPHQPKQVIPPSQIERWAEPGLGG